MSEILLKADRVSVQRGYRELLAGLSFSVGSGELWQLVGENGAGKTSLLRGLAGLAKFGIEGEIERPQSLLYLGHAPATKPLLSAADNLRWHPAGDTEVDLDDIYAALAAVGLAGFEERLVRTLSAGQQRRVALARLWLSQTKLWLLDEPFTAIDVRGATLLEERLMAHAEKGGAIIFTSHQPNRFGERLKILDLSQYACA